MERFFKGNTMIPNIKTITINEEEFSDNNTFSNAPNEEGRNCGVYTYGKMNARLDAMQLNI